MAAYSVECVIGRGGFGIVYSATRRSDGLTVNMHTCINLYYLYDTLQVTGAVCIPGDRRFDLLLEEVDPPVYTHGLTAIYLGLPTAPLVIQQGVWGRNSTGRIPYWRQPVESHCITSSFLHPRRVLAVLYDSWRWTGVTHSLPCFCLTPMRGLAALSYSHLGCFYNFLDFRFLKGFQVLIQDTKLRPTSRDSAMWTPQIAVNIRISFV